MLGDPDYELEIERRILDVLSRNSFLHIAEIARKSKTTRITATKHLERLKKEGVVAEYRRGALRIFTLIKGGDTSDD